jgi:hypothetical protein
MLGVRPEWHYRFLHKILGRSRGACVTCCCDSEIQRMQAGDPAASFAVEVTRLANGAHTATGTCRDERSSRHVRINHRWVSSDALVTSVKNPRDQGLRPPFR